MKLKNIFLQYIRFIFAFVESDRAAKTYRYIVVGLGVGLAVGLGVGIVFEGAADLHYTTRERTATAQRWEAERQADRINQQQSTIEGRDHGNTNH